MLCENLSIPWIATGEIFRNAIATDTELGRQAAPYVEKGELVPDPITIELIRTAFQAEELDFLLHDLGQELDWAIWLDAPVPILMQRSLDRSREDDAPEIVRRRIDLFHQRTIPITEYYEPRHKLLRIDANRLVEDIQQDLLDRLKAKHL